MSDEEREDRSDEASKPESESGPEPESESEPGSASETEPEPPEFGDLGEPGEETTEEAPEETPLSGLRDRIERRKSSEAESEPEPSFEDLFTEMETEEVDSEALWDELFAAEAEAGPVMAGEPVEEPEADRDIRIIDDRICHRCPYFADPPEFGCTHDGTDILEVVDVDHYKVADCPMVGEEGERTVGGDGEAGVGSETEVTDRA